MKKFLLIVLLTSIFITKTQCQEKPTPADCNRFNRTDDYLEKMMDSLKIVGLNYAILTDNEVVYEKAFGLANMQLTREQLENIWTPVKLANGTYGSFGLGWEAYYLQDNYRMAGHGGAGISSFRHYWNEQTNENMTVVLLTNGAFDWRVSPNQINAQIAALLLAD